MAAYDRCCMRLSVSINKRSLGSVDTTVSQSGPLEVLLAFRVGEGSNRSMNCSFLGRSRTKVVHMHNTRASKAVLKAARLLIVSYFICEIKY